MVGTEAIVCHSSWQFIFFFSEFVHRKCVTSPSLVCLLSTTMPSQEQKDNIIVVGAGLVGCLFALSLQKKGFQVTLYERYKDFRSIPSLGRSINLVLTGRGLRAVAQIGKDVLDEIVSMGSPVTGRVMHNTYTSERIFQRYGKDDTEFNISISRFELNKYLIKKAVDAGAKVQFNHNLSSADFSGEWAKLTFQTPQGQVVVDAGCPVVGADGGGSRIRYQMRDAGLTTFTEEKCIQGYAMSPKTCRSRSSAAAVLTPVAVFALI